MTNRTKTKSPDLEQVKAEFEAWRSNRTSRRIPDTLWAKALALLDNYTISRVSRELRLDPIYLRQRQVKAPESFLELTAQELSTKTLASSSQQTSSATSATTEQTTQAACRILIERADGSRLSFSLSVDCNIIESLCTSFLRA
jgi:hypothetical protein